MTQETPPEILYLPLTQPPRRHGARLPPAAEPGRHRLCSPASSSHDNDPARGFPTAAQGRSLLPSIPTVLAPAFPAVCTVLPPPSRPRASHAPRYLREAGSRSDSGARKKRRAAGGKKTQAPAARAHIELTSPRNTFPPPSPPPSLRAPLSPGNTVRARRGKASLLPSDRQRSFLAPARPPIIPPTKRWPILDPGRQAGAPRARHVHSDGVARRAAWRLEKERQLTRTSQEKVPRPRGGNAGCSSTQTKPWRILAILHQGLFEPPGGVWRSHGITADLQTTKINSPEEVWHYSSLMHPKPHLPHSPPPKSGEVFQSGNIRHTHSTPSVLRGLRCSGSLWKLPFVTCLVLCVI